MEIINLDSYIVYNTEISSVYEDAELLKIEAIKIENGKIVNTFCSFINPNIKVNKEVLQICNISKKDLLTAPKTIEVLTQFKEFVNDNLLIGYNQTLVDMPIINKSVSIQNYQIDLLNLIQKYIGLADYRIATVCNHFNIQFDSGCKALYQIFEQVKHLVSKEDIIKL